AVIALRVRGETFRRRGGRRISPVRGSDKLRHLHGLRRRARILTPATREHHRPADSRHLDDPARLRAAPGERLAALLLGQPREARLLHPLSRAAGVLAVAIAAVGGPRRPGGCEYDDRARGRHHALVACPPGTG